MAAGNHQAQERRFQFGVCQIISGDMTADMMNRDQGFVQCQRRGLGKIHANQHRSNETGGISDCHRVNIPTGQSGLRQSLVCQTVNGFDMLAGGDLRHHTAVFPVEGHLRCDAVCQHFPSIPDNGDGSFITGRFNCQNIQTSHSFLRISASSLGLR